jgi:hypothetical protein
MSATIFNRINKIDLSILPFALVSTRELVTPLPLFGHQDATRHPAGLLQRQSSRPLLIEAVTDPAPGIAAHNSFLNASCRVLDSTT